MDALAAFEAEIAGLVAKQEAAAEPTPAKTAATPAPASTAPAPKKETSAVISSKAVSYSAKPTKPVPANMQAAVTQAAPQPYVPHAAPASSVVVPSGAPGAPYNPYTPQAAPTHPRNLQVASKKKKKRGGDDAPKNLRVAGGKIWQDKTLDEWPENDHRVFCGDIGNEVNDTSLAKLFQHYPSFVKAKVVRDPKTQKTKGYGFVSFMDPFECAQAIREQNGKYVGNRPIKLTKSKWKKRAYVTKRNRKNKNHLF